MPVRQPTNRSVPQKNAPRGRLNYDIEFFGTLDTTTDPALMDDANSPDTLNTVYDTIKSVASRAGYNKLLTTSLTNFIGGMYPLYLSNGTRQLIYASGNQLYKYNNAGGSTALSGTPATFTSNKQWSFDEYQDAVYGGNGTDGLISYNGSSYTLANSGITPQYVKIHKNRVFCTNANSSRVYFSDAGNPTSFPANNFIDINTNDGQKITGLAELLDSLVIFKDNSVWILTGEPLGAGNTTTVGNLQLRQANSDVGCSAFRTIQRVGSTLFFMHYTGIYALQNYTVTLVSPLLNTTFKNGMNQSFISSCWSVYSTAQKKYILGYPSANSSTCDSALVFDLLTKGFTRWDHIPGNCGTVFQFSGTVESVLMGDPSKGNIYQLFQGTADIYGDNGTATGGSSTTLVDSTKNWTTNALVDARVIIISGTGASSIGVVTANTATTITVGSWSGSAPAAGSVYSVGYFTSYWTTKIHDFGQPGYTKKYKYFNVFIDSETYPVQFGYAIDFAAIAFQKNLNLTSGSLTWGQANLNWGPSSGNWGSYSSEFAQANIAGNGRYIQYIFGNNKANQPWRVIRYGTTFKLKKERPNILTT